jgi:hypothetical protein
VPPCWPRCRRRTRNRSRAAQIPRGRRTCALPGSFAGGQLTLVDVRSCSAGNGSVSTLARPTVFRLLSSSCDGLAFCFAKESSGGGRPDRVVEARPERHIGPNGLRPDRAGVLESRVQTGRASPGWWQVVIRAFAGASEGSGRRRRAIPRRSVLRGCAPQIRRLLASLPRPGGASQPLAGSRAGASTRSRSQARQGTSGCV